MTTPTRDRVREAREAPSLWAAELRDHPERHPLAPKTTLRSRLGLDIYHSKEEAEEEIRRAPWPRNEATAVPLYTAQDLDAYRDALLDALDADVAGMEKVVDDDGVLSALPSFRNSKVGYNSAITDTRAAIRARKETT